MSGVGSGVVAAVGAWPRDRVVVRRAIDEASHRRSTLTVLHIDELLDGRAVGHEGGHVDESPPLSDATVFVGVTAPALHVRTSLRPGPVVAGIVRASRDADLVVLGSEGAPPLAKLVRGAVTANVVARAHCPVEVVHVPEVAAAASPCVRVVALLTAADQLAVVADVAFAAARRYRARLDFWAAMSCSRRRGDPGGEELLDCRRRLQSALAPWLREYADVPCDIAVSARIGDAATLTALESTDLVVTVRGEGPPFWGRPDGATRLLIERACCPVLVVPPRSSDRR